MKVLLGLAFILSTGVASVETSPAAQNAAEPPVSASEHKPGTEMVCRRERVLGSLTKTIKTCKTRAQRREESKDAGDALNDYRHDK